MNNKPIATAYTDHIDANKKCVMWKDKASAFENEKQNTIDK